MKKLLIIFISIISVLPAIGQQLGKYNNEKYLAIEMQQWKEPGNGANAQGRTPNPDPPRPLSKEQLDILCTKLDGKMGGWHGEVGSNRSGASYAFPIGGYLHGFSSTYVNGYASGEPYIGMTGLSGNDNFLQTQCTPVVNLPVVPPGSTTPSIRLGWGGNSNNSVAERIYKKIKIDATTANFYFKYAYVMQGDFSAFFMIRVYDVATGNVIKQKQTPYHNVYSTSLPGPIVPGVPFHWETDPYLAPTFTTTIPGDAADSKIFYRNWTCDSINLSRYIDKEVLIEFTNADCQWGGHFAYTYLNDFCVSCDPTPPPTCSCEGFKFMDAYFKTYNNKTYGPLTNVLETGNYNVSCLDTVRFFSNFVCQTVACRSFTMSVKDQNGVSLTSLSNFNEYVFNKSGKYTVTLDLGCGGSVCKHFTFTIDVLCPCECPPKQQTKLNIFSGRGGPVYQPIATVACGGKFTGECLKNYTFTSSFTCPDNCTGSSTIRVVSPDKKDTTGAISNFQFTEKGDWQVLMYTRCGDTNCDTCKFTITIPPCVCPPPECCKDQVSFGGNASIKMTATGTGSVLTIASTITAGSTMGYKEVRIDVLDVAIESENKNPACMGCLTNPRQWASIQRAYVNGFTLSQEIPQMNNPREVRFISSTPKPLNNTPFGFHIILPPPSTLECCKLYAVVTIKITVRDDQCRECTFISRTKLLLANWQMGNVPATGNPADNNTGARKSSDLFKGCLNCLPVSGLKGLKSTGIRSN
jgi:hypothetical protein